MQFDFWRKWTVRPQMLSLAGLVLVMAANWGCSSSDTRLSERRWGDRSIAEAMTTSPAEPPRPLSKPSTRSEADVAAWMEPARPEFMVAELSAFKEESFKEESKAMPTTKQQYGQVQHAGEDTFSRQVLRSDVPVLVDFYADWCGPCKMLSPALEQVARENPHAKVVKVNIDNSPRLASRYGVDSIPNVKVFKNGRVVAEHVGVANASQLSDMLRR